MLSLQNGDDVKTVQENLGHATAAFTLDVYGHVSERMKEDSAARMQGYFENLKKAWKCSVDLASAEQLFAWIVGVKNPIGVNLGVKRIAGKYSHNFSLRN